MHSDQILYTIARDDILTYHDGKFLVHTSMRLFVQDTIAHTNKRQVIKCMLTCSHSWCEKLIVAWYNRLAKDKSKIKVVRNINRFVSIRIIDTNLDVMYLLSLPGHSRDSKQFLIEQKNIQTELERYKLSMFMSVESVIRTFDSTIHARLNNLVGVSKCRKAIYDGLSIGPLINEYVPKVKCYDINKGYLSCLCEGMYPINYIGEFETADSNCYNFYFYDKLEYTINNEHSHLFADGYIYPFKKSQEALLSEDAIKSIKCFATIDSTHVYVIRFTSSAHIFTQLHTNAILMLSSLQHSRSHVGFLVSLFCGMIGANKSKYYYDYMIEDNLVHWRLNTREVKKRECHTEHILAAICDKLRLKLSVDVAKCHESVIYCKTDSIFSTQRLRLKVNKNVGNYKYSNKGILFDRMNRYVIFDSKRAIDFRGYNSKFCEICYDKDVEFVKFVRDDKDYHIQNKS